MHRLAFLFFFRLAFLFFFFFRLAFLKRWYALILLGVVQKISNEISFTLIVWCLFECALEEFVIPQTCDFIGDIVGFPLTLGI